MVFWCFNDHPPLDPRLLLDILGHFVVVVGDCGFRGWPAIEILDELHGVVPSLSVVEEIGVDGVGSVVIGNLDSLVDSLVQLPRRGRAEVGACCCSWPPQGWYR